MPFRLAVLGLFLVILLGGCGLAKRAAIGFVYDRVDLPDANVERNIAYLDTGDPKHRLNLFLPVVDSVRAQPWPVVVFVHGGGWTEGDRDYEFGGADLYNNIGRMFAQHGIGAATVSYRLMPGVTWREQVQDVAAAVGWVHRHIEDYGGDPSGIVLMGHSAGGYLASYVALDPEPLAQDGLSTDILCGVMPISGAGLDLTDRETYLLEDNFDYYSPRFSPDRERLNEPPAEPFGWQVEASPITYVRPDAPPFLMVYAGGETDALQRQSHLLEAALTQAGVRSRIVVEPGKSHERIVPVLSQDGSTAGRAMLAFVRGLACR